VRPPDATPCRSSFRAIAS